MRFIHARTGELVAHLCLLIEIQKTSIHCINLLMIVPVSRCFCPLVESKATFNMESLQNYGLGLFKRLQKSASRRVVVLRAQIHCAALCRHEVTIRNVRVKSCYGPQHRFRKT